MGSTSVGKVKEKIYERKREILENNEVPICR